MPDPIAVLGAGNGACAAAADLSRRGFSVRLCELPEFSAGIEPIRRRGGLDMEGVLGQVFVKVDLITTDLEEAVRGTGVVMVCVPAYAVDEWGRRLAPIVDERHLVVFNGSGNAGALRVHRLFAAAERHALVAETNSLTYGCRKLAPDRVGIFLMARGVFVAAFPGRRTDEAAERFRAFYPDITPAAHVMETTLNNGNPVSHPTPVVLNAGRIEKAKGDFYLYPEGITPAVAQVMQALDDERLALCRALGLREMSSQERIVRLGYARPGRDLYETYQNSDVYPRVKGPASLRERYLTEDVPYGLVLWSTLGDQIGVATPVMDAVITLASGLVGEDYRTTGLTMEKLGLAGMERERLLRFLSQGT